jgi:hypothetical protein
MLLDLLITINDNNIKDAKQKIVKKNILFMIKCKFIRLIITFLE